MEDEIERPFEDFDPDNFDVIEIDDRLEQVVRSHVRHERLTKIGNGAIWLGRMVVIGLSRSGGMMGYGIPTYFPDNSSDDQKWGF